MAENNDNTLGQGIFTLFFGLSDKDLIVKLISIHPDLQYMLVNVPKTITRIIENEIPVKIEIEGYDMVFINHEGIMLHPEHSLSRQLAKFDMHFKF